MKILIFGGTGEARELAGRLTQAGHAVTSSLAGRTLKPLLPQGSVRIGGFGDVPSLKAWLRAQGFQQVVDATHPFAERISVSVARACNELGLPLIRLCRPPWKRPDGAEWIEVNDVEQAQQDLPADAVLLVTIGQKALQPGTVKPKCKRVIRLIELPEGETDPADTIVLDRPPYTVAGEKAFMQRHGITHVLTKNSGGAQTWAKIEAAADLGIPVLMIPRPELPQVAQEVETVDAAVALLQEPAS